MAGDMLLISNYAEGYYFGAPIEGVHGGLHPDDSSATFFLGAPKVDQQDWLATKKNIQQAIENRCAEEGGRQPSTADLYNALQAILD